MTKTTDTNSTPSYAVEAEKLAEAVQATIVALKDNDHADHAEAVECAMAGFLRGNTMVEIDTLHQWLALFETAHELISDSGDECTVDETADLAFYCISKEISVLEAAAWNPMMSYDVLNRLLNDAYETLADLPRLADATLDARVQRVVQMLDELTYDTWDGRHLAEAGIDPNGAVEATVSQASA